MKHYLQTIYEYRSVWFYGSSRKKRDSVNIKGLLQQNIFYATIGKKKQS
jgi:hypothetical protein